MKYRHPVILLATIGFLILPGIAESEGSKNCTVNCLAEMIEEQYGIDRRAAREQTEEVFQMIEQALLSGKRVQIRSFGSFYLQARGARKARNPRTGRVILVPPKKYPRFRSSELLKERLNRR